MSLSGCASLYTNGLSPTTKAAIAEYEQANDMSINEMAFRQMFILPFTKPLEVMGAIENGNAGLPDDPQPENGTVCYIGQQRGVCYDKSGQRVLTTIKW